MYLRVLLTGRVFNRLSPSQVDRGVAYRVHDRTFCACGRSPRNGGRSDWEGGYAGAATRIDSRPPAHFERDSAERCSMTTSGAWPRGA